MAHRRTKKQWLELLEQQQQSGLSVAEFCRTRDLNPKNLYYQIKRQRSETTEPAAPAFVRAELDSARIDHQEQQGIKLQRGRCQLRLPANTSPRWVAELMMALS